MSIYHRDAVPPLFASTRLPNATLALASPPRTTPAQATRWDTQDAAYLAVPPGVAQPIMEMLRERPSTCDECEDHLKLTHQTCSAAINKLMKLGFIVAGGSRKTRSGRLARIWEVK